MVAEKDNHKPFESNAAGKVYNTPQLIVYGDIREVTQVVGDMGMNDMAGGVQKTAI